MSAEFTRMLGSFLQSEIGIHIVPECFLAANMTVLPSVLLAEALGMPEMSTVSGDWEPSLWTWTHGSTRLLFQFGLGVQQVGCS